MNYVQRAQTLLLNELPEIEDAPALFDLYVLLVLTRGESTSLEDVHDAWAVWRNLSNPVHKSLIPFDQLTGEVQELDRKYMDGIHAAARKLAVAS